MLGDRLDTIDTELKDVRARLSKLYDALEVELRGFEPSKKDGQSSSYKQNFSSWDLNDYG